MAVLRNLVGGWMAIRPLLTDGLATIEIEEGLQAYLGRVIPPPEESIKWLLDIPERYHTNPLERRVESLGDLASAVLPNHYRGERLVKVYFRIL